MSLDLNAAERIVWYAWGPVSFLVLVVYLRWAGPLQDQKNDEPSRVGKPASPGRRNGSAGQLKQ